MDKKEEKIQTPTSPIQLKVNVPEGTNVLYCDSAFVTASNFGLVLDFAQSMASTSTQTVVARIGMSKEHAEVLLGVLQGKLVQMQNMSYK